MSASGPTTIREASLADLRHIMQLEQGSATAAHWKEADYERTFADQERGDHLLKQIALVIESGGDAKSLIGFIVARAVGRDWEIENIVVAASAQRQGHGLRLLKELIERARKEFAQSILLDVRESNHAAISLYKRSGFEQDGRRKNYYSNPDEDALLLQLAL